MNIFVKSNKIHKNSNKAKSATGSIKPNKNHFKNTKIISNLFLSKISDVGNHITQFSVYFIFGEK